MRALGHVFELTEMQSRVKICAAGYFGSTDLCDVTAGGGSSCLINLC